jgi:hypothetical protein
VGDGESIRILITGSRDWACHELAESVIARLIARYGPNLVIVHGAARGVDLSFEMAAKEHDLVTEPHPADWDKHGRGAGPKRNEAMVAAGATLCIAVSRDIRSSKGTQGCARLALAANIPTVLIDNDEGLTRWLTREDLA